MTVDQGTVARPKPKPKGYSWTLGPSGTMLCIADGRTQTVGPRLWEAEAATEAHDNVLIEVTREVNGILDEIATKCPHLDWELSLIRFHDRYMLAWTKPVRGGLRPGDDPREIAEVLRLRRDTPD